MLGSNIIHWFDEIDSTNEEARRRLDDATTKPQWFVAKRQSAGRGRRGRQWVSNEGNVFATALFRFEGEAEKASLLSYMTALAVHDTLADYVDGDALKFKWPNDIRYKRQKLCGMLLESGRQSDGLWIAAGIGINRLHAPDNVGQKTISIAEIIETSREQHKLPDLKDMVESLAFHYEKRLYEFIHKGFTPKMRQEWLDRAESLGDTITVSQGVAGKPMAVTGKVLDLSDTGELVIETTDQGLIHISSGEIIEEVS